MRLLRLDLLRYGHLTDIALDFPPEAALHVVLGANEAGKTTALEAIGDALFGFEHKTTRDFLHDARALRIGLTLGAGDGATARFLRRKGRRDTLTDPEDAPLPEEALRRFLGGADRALFKRSFGLDSAGLRAGAQALLDGEGEAGESFFSALGLPLHDAEQALAREAASLHGDGRGRRRLAQALEAYQQARRALDEAAIRPRDWEAATAEHAALQAEAQAMQARLDGLAAENDRLLRIRGTRPILKRLDDAEAEIAPLADAPRLPPDAAPRLARAAAAAREASRDLVREEAEVARLGADLGALVPDAALLARQDRIDALAARRASVQQAEADLPGVAAQVLAHRSAVAEAARDLCGDPPDALREAVPAEAVRRRAQRLLTTRATLVAQRDQRQDLLAAAERRATRLAALLAETPAPADPTRLRRAIEAARAEGRLDAEIAAVMARHTRAAQATAAALAALPLWSGEATALAACPLPLPAEAAAAGTTLAAAEAALREAEGILGQAGQDIAAEEERMAMLARGEAVPTPALVAAARARRDDAWRVLRAHLDGPTPAAPPDADAFEALRDAADALADRRAEDAQRVADYATAEARHALLRARLPGLDQARADAATALDAARSAWAALWAPAGLVPQGPAAMEEWRRARAEALRLHAAEAELAARVEELGAARARVATALRALLPALPPGDALAPLLDAAEARCAQDEAALADHRCIVAQAAEARETVPVERAALAALDERLGALARDWAEVAAALHLPPTADPEALEAALAAWQRIAEAAPAWREAETRVAAMRTTIEGFAAAVGAMVGELGAEAAGQPPVDSIARLARALAAARRAEAEAEALRGRIADHVAARREAAERRAAAEAELALLRDAAGCADDEALAAAIDRAARRDVLAGEIAGLRRTLAEQGGGLPEDRLRAEAAATDPEDIAARLEAIARERAECAAALERLGGHRAGAEQRLAEMRRGRDAAGAAQRMADALAEARHAAERYARVHVARTLLRAGVERFRLQQQTPLLRAAGAHFAALTRGRYVALLAEQDEQGRNLLHARRADGADCPMAALSEGTRDQLYLALRVAMVETLAARMEPLPFIADDLLVTFDDARADAALGLLAALGRRTQVILFTHHAHVAELARRRGDVAVQQLAAA